MHSASPKKRHDDSLRAAGAILLVSCYELGQQPLGLAMPMARLEDAGFEPEAIDLAVDLFDESRVTHARVVAISVPMHTALRIGVGVAHRTRQLNPDCVVVFYGLYAALNATHLLDTVADVCLGAEFEAPLVELALTLDAGGKPPQPRPDISRELAAAKKAAPLTPKRNSLPPLSRYARLVKDGQYRNSGSVVTTRGCKHLCRHCPLPPLYNGRFYALPVDAVISDIQTLVDAGAEHITFADPDFLNGPTHAQRIAREMHARFPNLTFDYTAKIEHLNRHRDIVHDLKAQGSVFVVSAVESVNDRTLKLLAKGHRRKDIVDVIRFFRDIDLSLRPTFVPFTPWDTIADYRALLDIVEGERLIDHIDPVQYSIRLLVPPGSFLLRVPEMRAQLGDLDASRLTYTWTHPEPEMDELQRAVAAIAADAARNGRDAAETFFVIKGRAAPTGLPALSKSADAAWIRRRFPLDRHRPPGLTENWFC